MNTTVTAYLVVWMDMTVFPLIVEVGVYGEAHPSSTDLVKRRPVMLTSSRGSTYENAVASLMRYCKTTPGWHWALPHFPKAGT